MLIGLRQYGFRNMDDIKKMWLPEKSTSEIKHRFKNLTCARVPNNQIKQWKLTHALPLTDIEVNILAAALRWFGTAAPRWHVISQLLLPHRSPNFLKLEYFNILSDHKKSTYFAQAMLNVVNVEETLQQYIKQQPMQLDEQSCLYDIASLP